MILLADVCMVRLLVGVGQGLSLTLNCDSPVLDPQNASLLDIASMN